MGLWEGSFYVEGLNGLENLESTLLISFKNRFLCGNLHALLKVN